VVIELRDTVRETQTITITKNENGDTLKVIQTTDRTRARDASRMQDRNEKLTVVRDTVYVERRDSVLVSNTNLTNQTNEKGGGFRSTLKWIFFIILSLIAFRLTAYWVRRAS